MGGVSGHPFVMHEGTSDATVAWLGILVHQHLIRLAMKYAFLKKKKKKIDCLAPSKRKDCVDTGHVVRQVFFSALLGVLSKPPHVRCTTNSIVWNRFK